MGGGGGGGAAVACSKWTMETQKMCERRHWRGSDVFIVNVEQILYINLMFPLFTLNR